MVRIGDFKLIFIRNIDSIGNNRSLNFMIFFYLLLDCLYLWVWELFFFLERFSRDEEI